MLPSAKELYTKKTMRVLVDASAEDAGSDPVTLLRKGLVMAKQTADGHYYPIDLDAIDGTQIPVGILAHDLDLSGGVDKHARIIVAGRVTASTVINFTASIRSRLASRIWFDDDTNITHGGFPFLMPRGVYRKGSNYEVLASESGCLFVATAAVEFTLPNAVEGLSFMFVQSTDNLLKIIGDGDLLVTVPAASTATGNSVTFDVTNLKIGTTVLVTCIYIAANTVKWLVIPLCGTPTVSSVA